MHGEISVTSVLQHAVSFKVEHSVEVFSLQEGNKRGTTRGTVIVRDQESNSIIIKPCYLLQCSHLTTLPSNWMLNQTGIK
jgi:hypothetical protein